MQMVILFVKYESKLNELRTLGKQPAQRAGTHVVEAHHLRAELLREREMQHGRKCSSLFSGMPAGGRFSSGTASGVHSGAGGFIVSSI